MSDGELLSPSKSYRPGCEVRTVPTPCETIEGFLGALDAAGVLRALSAIAENLAASADPARSDKTIHRLKSMVMSRIAAIRASQSAHELDDEFVNRLLDGRLDLGRDLMALQGIVVKGVYA